MILINVRNIIGTGKLIPCQRKTIFEMIFRFMKNKRRGLKEQPRKKPIDIEKKIKNPKKYEEKMHFDTLSKGELYLPESCKAKKLAMLCNRLYYFNINDEELLDRYAERAVVIVNSMNTKEMSLVLNTMRKFNHKNEKLLEAFAKHIPRKLHKGVPQDISLILNAYAHFNFIDNNLFSRICEEIPHKIPYFEHSHISSVINAFYKLKIKDKIIIADMVDEIIERIDEFDTKSLTNIINCFSKMNYKNENKKIIWTKFIEAVKRLYKEFNFLEIVLVTNAFCKKKMKNQNVYKFLSEILSYHIFKMTSLNDTNAFLLCTIAHAFSKVKYYSKELFDYIISHFSNKKNYVSLDTQHFSQLIYSCSVFSLNNELFLDVFTKMVCTRLDEKYHLNEQTLSTIAYSFAKLKFRDTNFFVLLSSYIIKEKISLSPQSLSLLCYSYSKLKIKSELFFYILSLQIIQNMNKFTKQGLSIILSAYSNLRIFNVKMFSLINKYLNLYVENCTNEECTLICKNYEHAIRCIDDEIGPKMEKSVEMDSVNEMGKVHEMDIIDKKNDKLSGESNERNSFLVRTSNIKKELGDFVQILKIKMQHFEEKKKLTQEHAGFHLMDEKGQMGEEHSEVEVEENDESFFSIFNENDILCDEPKDGTTNRSDNNSEQPSHFINPDVLFNNMDDHADDIKKKETTLKMYEKMFLTDTQGTTYNSKEVPLVNSRLNKQLCNILDNQNSKINENKYQILDEKGNRKTKSLLELMTSNKPPKVNYEKEKLIKSAEQVETEFIKEYINEQNKSNENDKIGRKFKKRKKKIQKILSKKYEPVDDLTTLQEKWRNFYKN
ncbi:heptatricopeptide repeat-containing protein [Plasmodium brasilianum]|uniref:RNA-editing substrate-binding complex 8 protein HEAT repeats domain-containing protein n=2 Tax=Plasmodium (Plasmodium) TaxID=418103 RepID=A0A1A8WD98_PLAMA|nr:conserved Plasmodium protein, unknown function [Plasmodium malariae]KAI4834929.1 heptatricopeptide repeat-containing protein [Plasmodium brasilianum]SBS90847.1 hypothetical protein, conserved [Plasmodium malariae]SCP03499.1 conserved Plasmodium protein, unknown function [Plasmodium malariae]